CPPTLPVFPYTTLFRSRRCCWRDRRKRGSGMAKTILIVEDEKNIVDILSYNLDREGYATLEAYDGETGLQLGLEQDPDLILLDRSEEHTSELQSRFDLV